MKPFSGCGQGPPRSTINFEPACRNSPVFPRQRDWRSPQGSRHGEGAWSPNPSSTIRFRYISPLFSATFPDYASNSFVFYNIPVYPPGSPMRSFVFMHIHGSLVRFPSTLKNSFSFPRRPQTSCPSCAGPICGLFASFGAFAELGQTRQQSVGRRTAWYSQAAALLPPGP